MDNGGSCYSRYLSGDDSAMTELVFSYKDGLTMYLCTILGDLNDAEDVAEETFFRIAYRRPAFSGKSSFKTWLYKIGRNIALDALRRRFKGRKADPEELADIAGDLDIEENYIKEERRIAIHRALRRLNPDYRQAVCLVYLEGFKPGEAAVVMGRSSRQMTNLLYRARAALKNELEKEGVTDAGL